MALKKGLDQLSAWILATVATGGMFGIGYGLVNVIARHAPKEDISQEEAGEAPAERGGEGHGEGHGESSAKKDEPNEPASKKMPGDAEEEPEGSPKSEGGEHAESAVPHWDYKGSLGPDHWGSLAEAFKLCEVGRQQSPIDIDAPTSVSKLLPIRFHYKEGDALISNNGHTVGAKMPTGSYVEIDGDRFDLVEFHFHAPGEHKIAGAAYDFELHLVHKDAEGHLAVIGVLFEEGAASKALAPLWRQLPSPGESLPEPVTVDPTSFLPSRRIYYSYAGSLTTPPCNEGVKWFVLTDPVPIAAKQVDAFAHVVPFNARPVQPLHGRKVSKSTRS